MSKNQLPLSKKTLCALKKQLVESKMRLLRLPMSLSPHFGRQSSNKKPTPQTMSTPSLATKRLSNDKR